MVVVNNSTTFKKAQFRKNKYLSTPLRFYSTLILLSLPVYQQIFSAEYKPYLQFLCLRIFTIYYSKKATYSDLFKHYYFVASFHSSSLNPTQTVEPVTRIGRFTSIPSVARSSYFSSSVISGSLSFNFISL